MKKTATMNLQGKEYAQVKDRLKEFRKDNTNGLIETIPTINGEVILFKARILKDKSNPDSGEATGHSMGVNKGVKAFEKLETIAVGRALSLLGYSSDGEIASSEEMEEFLDYKEQQRVEKLQELFSNVDEIKTLPELQKFYLENKGVGKEFDKYVVDKRDILKKQ